MKLLYTLLPAFLVLLSQLPAAAQHYAPFRTGYTPHYQVGDSIYTMRLQLKTVQGQDSVFEFNPRVVPVQGTVYVPSCTPGSTVAAQELRNFDNLYGYRMLRNGAGDYRFVFTSGDTFLLKPYAPIGASWTFAQQPALTATLVNRTLANLDSIVTISLSNGNQIVISRRFGLYSSRSFYSYLHPATNTTQPMQLVRLPEAGWGKPMNHPFTYYDLQVGDKLKYYTRVDQAAMMGGITLLVTCRQVWRTIEVIGRYDTPGQDTIWYQFRSQMLSTSPYFPNNPCFYMPGTTLSPFDTVGLMVIPANYPVLHHLSREHAAQAPNQPVTLLNRGHYRSHYNNRLAVTYSEVAADTCSATYQYFIDASAIKQYTEGLGETLVLNWGLGGEYRHELIAYVKGTDTYGNWQPLVDAREELVAATAPLQAYPNPFSGTLQLKLQLPSNSNSEALVYDLQGRLVHRQQLPVEMAEQTVALDLTQLPNALYLVQVQSGGRSYSVKVRKE